MSTFSSNESRLGSSCLQFLKLSLPPKKTPRLSLVQCVSAWAAENPNAPAIATATETLFYAELEAQSNALARHLQSLGATRETLIALVIERSPEFAIAALAAWKAG